MSFEKKSIVFGSYIYVLTWWSSSPREATKIEWKTAATKITSSTLILSLRALDGTTTFHFSAVLNVSNITSVPHNRYPNTRQITWASRCSLSRRNVRFFPWSFRLVYWRSWKNRRPIGLLTSRIPRVQTQVTSATDVGMHRGKASRPMTRDVRRTIGKRTKSRGFGKIPNEGKGRRTRRTPFKGLPLGA